MLNDATCKLRQLVADGDVCVDAWRRVRVLAGRFGRMRLDCARHGVDIDIARRERIAMHLLNRLRTSKQDTSRLVHPEDERPDSSAALRRNGIHTELASIPMQPYRLCGANCRAELRPRFGRLAMDSEEAGGEEMREDQVYMVYADDTRDERAFPA